MAVHTFQSINNIKIKKYQKNFKLFISKAPFSRLVREITKNIAIKEIRFQFNILKSLQETAKTYLINLFKGKYFDYYNNYY